MVKKISLFLSVVLILGMLTACATGRNEYGLLPSDPQSGQLEKAPMLSVVSGGSSEQRIQAAQLTTSWSYVDKNGNGSGYEADSPHALQLSDYAEHTLHGVNGDITLMFSDNYSPQSISVTKWDAGYAMGGQDIYDTLDKGEPVGVNGSTVNIGNAEGDYVYEVYAKFEQGSSYYAFRTINGTAGARFTGVVEEVFDGSILVRVNESEDAYKSSVLISVPLNGNTSQFSTGDEVRIYYDGTIMESYPAQLHTVYRIELINGAAQQQSDGVSMSISDITAGGLSFVFENSSGKEYLYGSDFALYVRKNEAWEAVEPIIENWGFTSEGYPIMPHSNTEITPVDWRWLFGELPAGEYRFEKTVLFIREPGDYDTFVFEQEFRLP
jgi:hypothetical protein